MYLTSVLYLFQAIVRQELFFRTLFVCCVELVLKCYNDPRKFPWSLQVMLNCITVKTLQLKSLCVIT